MPTVPSHDVEMRPLETNASTTVINCKKLYDFVTDRSVSMLIMDCRPANEYEASHLTYKECVNIPEEIIKKGFVSKLNSMPTSQTDSCLLVSNY